MQKCKLCKEYHKKYPLVLDEESYKLTLKTAEEIVNGYKEKGKK